MICMMCARFTSKTIPISLRYKRSAAVPPSADEEVLRVVGPGLRSGVRQFAGFSTNCVKWCALLSNIVGTLLRW